MGLGLVWLSVQVGLVRTKDLAFLSATLMRGHPLARLAIDAALEGFYMFGRIMLQMC